MLEMEVLKGNDLRDIRNHPVIRDMDTFVDTGTVRNTRSTGFGSAGVLHEIGMNTAPPRFPFSASSANTQIGAVACAHG